MTDRFLALPVGQGDAFFFQRRKFSALIDGGRSRHTFSSLFRNTVKREDIDVLVCTHNDADHANGILGFLESDLRCREVWLPALWQDRLDDLLTKPMEFLDELVHDVDKHTEFDEQVRLDQIGNQFAEANDEETDSPSNVERSERTSPQIGEDDDGNSMPDSLGWSCYCGWRDLPLAQVIRFHRDPRRCQLLLQALSAASRIRDIAVACIHRGILIRWFRHSQTQANGGKPGLLTPLNAIEISRIRHTRALRWLALSTANRLSLTLCSPPLERYPGIVFTADSDLRFSAQIPWSPDMIVTAPHHGSEANRSAYSRFHRDIKDEFDVIWIRSDGNYKSRPGSSYLRERQRFCTLCRSQGAPKQAVALAVKNGHWAPTQAHVCACR